jgi:biopolymer transport protein TolR
MISNRIQNKRQSQTKLITEMNVVPYIDVMLVLLIIFMVTTPLIQHTVEVDLPATTSEEQTTDTNVEPFVITVDANGLFYLNTEQQPYNLQDITFEMLAYSEMYQNNFSVYIRGDKKTSYENIIVVMNVLKNYGIDKVNLMTDIEN